MDFRLGGVFQADYCYYAEEQRADNRFDISKARLRLGGHLTPYLSLAMEYEFQGNETDNLVEAYAEADLGFSSLRLGQFKEPFGLEWQSADKAQFFAQRSMGYYLGPGRDIGLMLHGSWLKDAITANFGLFNGDGEDGSASGPESDSPEAAARVTFSPFMNSASPLLKGIHLGASATHAEIDPLNVDLRVKSTGMAGTDRNLMC